MTSKRYMPQKTVRIVIDILNGVRYGIWHSRHHVVHSYVVVPAGLIILLAILYGFNILLSDVAKVNFPSSVLCMLLNLIILIVLNVLSKLQSVDNLSGRIWAKKCGQWAAWTLEHYLMMIRPCMNFSLKWINVFFIPSFVILPLSDPITIVECIKIAAVFLIGGVLLMVIDVYMILLLKKLAIVSRSLFFGGTTSSSDPAVASNEDEGEILETSRSKRRPSYILAQDDITTIDMDILRSGRTEATSIISSSLPPNNYEDSHNLERLHSRDCPPETSVSISSYEESSSVMPLQASEVKPRESDRAFVANEAFSDELSSLSQSIAIFISSYMDWLLYAALFLIAIPFYYIRGIHVMLPFHLGLTVISYYAALLLLDTFPQTKRFAHPILVSTAIILFVCFISSLICHEGSAKGFLADLKYYKTGKNYLNLFNGEALYNGGKVVPQSNRNFTSQPMWPGCGDFLSSLMDISIVSLSLPMFTHRRDFLQNFWILAPPILISVTLTFFCYPIICYNIGISSERSIGFIGRSVTLALGTPLITSLGGSVSLMAVCTILSGIFGVLIGDTFFKLLRIPPNDYVTRGVTLGINCGAIATAHLLSSDPRAASMSSLSFSVFGTTMIILASIGVVRDLLRGWVNL